MVRHSTFFLLCFSFGFALCGCWGSQGGSATWAGYGEDSWAHYTSGGDFVTTSPSISPDGRTMVYASPTSGCGDIYSMNIDSGAVVQITKDPAYEASPKFFPSENRIAFLRESNGRRHIWVMNVDGTEQVALTHGNVLDDLEQISVDGATILFSRSKAGWGAGRLRRVFMLELKSRKLEPVQLGTYASLSLSGKAIAYCPVGDSDEIWVWNRKTGGKRRIGHGSEPQFSPSGDELLVMEDIRKDDWTLDRRIVLLGFSGANRRVLGTGHAPVFSPDGSRIVFLVGYGDDVWIVNKDGSSLIKVKSPAGPKTKPNMSAARNACTFSVLAGLPSESRIPRSFIMKLRSLTIDAISSDSNAKR